MDPDYVPWELLGLQTAGQGQKQVTMAQRRTVSNFHTVLKVQLDF